MLKMIARVRYRLTGMPFQSITRVKNIGSLFLRPFQMFLDIYFVIAEVKHNLHILGTDKLKTNNICCSIS